MVWIGLAWFGLVWIGLDWFGLVWIGLDWFRLVNWFVVALHFLFQHLQKNARVSCNALSEMNAQGNMPNRYKPRVIVTRGRVLQVVPFRGTPVSQGGVVYHSVKFLNFTVLGTLKTHLR